MPATPQAPRCCGICSPGEPQKVEPREGYGLALGFIKSGTGSMHRFAQITVRHATDRLSGSSPPAGSTLPPCPAPRTRSPAVPPKPVRAASLPVLIARRIEAFRCSLLPAGIASKASPCPCCAAGMVHSLSKTLRQRSRAASRRRLGSGGKGDRFSPLLAHKQRPFSFAFPYGRLRPLFIQGHAQGLWLGLMSPGCRSPLAPACLSRATVALVLAWANAAA